LRRSDSAVTGSANAGTRCLRRTENTRRSSMPWMWSAWSWVNQTASMLLDAGRQQLLAQVGRRVDEDRRLPSSLSSRAAWRVRRSRVGEVQVAQSQPTTGMPNDVPVPRNRSLTAPRCAAVGGAGHVERHAGGHDDALAGLRHAVREQVLAGAASMFS
jgi:hypothetical protein